MIIGHQKQWEFLKRSAESGKLSHAYLFSGQEKLGKKTVALEWISLLFGQPPTRIIGGGHPDFILVTPIGKDSNPPTTLSSSARASIQISQIRDLIWRLSLKPSISPLKAAIVDQAHLMNEEAQNCFLKTLEEPKGNTVLILITEAPEFLFPTILSRCQIIKFYPVKREEIENYLQSQGISESELKVISDISLGRPGIAIDFISNPQKLENQKKIIKELIEISNSPLAGRFQYAKNLAKTLNLREILDTWLSYFRNILLEKCSTLGAQKKRDVYFFSPKKLATILQKIQSTIFLISTTNVNPRLALEILLMEL